MLLKVYDEPDEKLTTLSNSQHNVPHYDHYDDTMTQRYEPDCTRSGPKQGKPLQVPLCRGKPRILRRA